MFVFICVLIVYVVLLSINGSLPKTQHTFAFIVVDTLK